MVRRLTLILLIMLWLATPVVGKYKAKQIEVKPAADYAFHQAFQDIVIAADPANTLEKSQQLFDTDKITTKGFLPVLIVVENGNSFPIRISEAEIYLVDQNGKRNPSLPFAEVLLKVSLKKPLSNLSSDKQLAAEKAAGKDMFRDFQEKAFGEKEVAPGGSAHGVVFFPLPDHGVLQGHSIYLPEVVDVSADKPLIFFEFSLE